MMPYLFKIGSFELRIYSVMIIIGLLMTIYFSRRRAAKFGVKPAVMENMIILLFIFSILGARLYYVAFNWGYYSQYPSQIFAVWNGGLAIHGGVILAFISAFFIHKYYKLPTMFTADIIAPLLLTAQGLGRIGNFANGEAHGVPTIVPPEIIFRLKPIFTEFWAAVLNTFQLPNTPEGVSKIMELAKASDIFVTFQGVSYQLKEYVPWGISFTDKYMSQIYLEFGTLPVHPTFFYEMILNFIGATIMFILLWRQDKYIGTGIIFGTYLISYGVIRAFVTMFRADDLMVGVFRAPHAASIGFAAVGVILIVLGRRKLALNKIAKQTKYGKHNKK